MVEMIIINSYLLKLCFISLFINGKFFKIVFVLIVRSEVIELNSGVLLVKNWEKLLGCNYVVRVCECISFVC